MTIALGCKGCGRLLRVKDEYAGKPIKCPHCQEVQLVIGEDHPSSTTKEEIVSSPKSNLLSFQGRIGRGRFWVVFLSMSGLSFMVGVLVAIINSAGEGSRAIGFAILVLWLIPGAWIGLATQVKRWHDMNLTGWMVLINVIPIVGTLFSFISYGFIKGTVGSNKYGHDPWDRGRL